MNERPVEQGAPVAEPLVRRKRSWVWWALPWTVMSVVVGAIWGLVQYGASEQALSRGAGVTAAFLAAGLFVRFMIGGGGCGT